MAAWGDNTSISQTLGFNQALIIVSGDRNGSNYCYTTGPSDDSRWVLNTKLQGTTIQWLFPCNTMTTAGDIVTSEDDIAASVNQMGIHVRWFEQGANLSGGATLPEALYAKAGRVFDEPIEERTIISDMGIIG